MSVSRDDATAALAAQVMNEVRSAHPDGLADLPDEAVKTLYGYQQRLVSLQLRLAATEVAAAVRDGWRRLTARWRTDPPR